MRLIFMGTPDFAVPPLRALMVAGHEICAVYCQPPRPAGRGQRLAACAVQQAAEQAGLEVRHPVSLKKPDVQVAFAELRADAAMVAAYGLILPKPVLMAPRLGCFNIHASLLPRWRGAAPIQRAILAGDRQTGVTIMQMDEGLDTGAMLARAETPISGATTAQSLHDALAELGAKHIVETLADLPNIHPDPQPEQGITYAEKLTREDGQIVWGDAGYVERQVRALTPWPGAWFRHRGAVIRVQGATYLPEMSGPAGQVLDGALSIGCATGGAVRITRLQRPGKASMATADFLRGYPLPPGTDLAVEAPCPGTA